MEDLDFETAFARLEETVRLLEAGGLSLEQSVALFEEGMRLAEYCNRRLDNAELRVGKLLTGDGVAGRAGQLSLDSYMMEVTPIRIASDRNDTGGRGDDD